MCHFIPMLLAFVVLGLVVSVQSQEVGWEERLCRVGHLYIVQVGRVEC